MFVSELSDTQTVIAQDKNPSEFFAEKKYLYFVPAMTDLLLARSSVLVCVVQAEVIKKKKSTVCLVWSCLRTHREQNGALLHP